MNIPLKSSPGLAPQSLTGLVPHRNWGEHGILQGSSDTILKSFRKHFLSSDLFAETFPRW